MLQGNSMLDGISHHIYFKNAMISLQRSDVVYEYKCHSDCRYFGCTAQKLQDKVNQQVPKSITLGVKKKRKAPIQKY